MKAENLLRALDTRDKAISARIALRAEQRTWRSPLFWAANIGAHLGDSLLWLGATAWLWRRDPGDEGRRRLRLWVTALLAALGATLGVKSRVRRERPGRGRFLHGAGADVHSFPSGHGARIGVLLAWGNVLWPGLGRLAPFLGLWIGWARVALGIHYVGDVLVGILLGLGIGRLLRTHSPSCAPD